ncbi:MAG: 3-hydroxyacyl-CoA dehydrogenase family protein [Chloroflexi bacterium]|nr:3-hydroxyacyl-CoA dehydrogenase family protein [Chloroflexota bacterium]
MGNGIAQVAAMAGYQVQMRDVEQALIDRALGTIQNSLNRLVKSGKLTAAQAEAACGRIQPTTDLAQAVGDADVVIEAVPEKLELKKQVFAGIDALCPAHAILATNTSQLSITALAHATRRPESFIGMHWFSPPVLMRLIEIVRGFDTSDTTVQIIQNISAQMGKETVVCKDSQGFITTRVFQAFLNECFRVCDEGIASMEDIDKAIKLGLNHPMGPFELTDYAGADVANSANEGLTEVFGDRFRSPQCLRRLIASGNLGRKTGRGFYRYK